MKRFLLLNLLILILTPLSAQIPKVFQRDTATFIQEMQAFTENRLQSDELPDYEAFLRMFDSIPYDQQLAIIDISNLMLEKKCRPRPHFISFQRIMTEFLVKGKTGHGYGDWMEGYTELLQGEKALHRNIAQCLDLTNNLLKDNVFYATNSIKWKVATPSFSFHMDSVLTVRFESVTLACYSGMDFIQVREATGWVDPLSLTWHGTSGRVTWERVGKPDTDMYARLGEFHINLKKPSYQADSVVLYYPGLFEGEVLGRLEDKVTLIKDVRMAKFPQFASYKSYYRINQFMPGVDYEGGLTIEGYSLVGTSVRDNPATLRIYSRDTLRVEARADRISMNDENIRSLQSELYIYFGEDSIFHPDVAYSYESASEQLRVNKTESFTSKGPYSNSYHRVDMNFDELYWKREENTMKFQALLGSSVGRANFESNTFFNYDFYMGLQGMDFAHPLVQLATYARVVRGREFNSGPFAAYAGYPEYQIKHQLMALSKLGFLYYDSETGMVTLRQKLFDFIDASMRKRDYDVINFNSRTEGVSNAEFNLDTRDLTIHGIPVIFLSDSQNVRLVPSGNSIVMKRNRSFQFDGMVDAGLMRFRGHNFFFNYDSFKIDMQQIDSLQMSINTGQTNQYGEKIQAHIDNAIENMTGELLIDDPNNKSGLESYPHYPIFNSRENSFIYFDSPNIQDGVYDRNVFYFELDPFSIDSLDNFRPEAISPVGTFSSAGILPPMELEMTLREDNSLGFYMQTPEDGLPMYGGMARFFNDIEMSSRGLHGYGHFDYITSTTWSDDFILHPDSMMSVTREFLVRERQEETQFPMVKAGEADMTLYPGEEMLALRRMEETYRIFDDSTYFGGDLALRPDGLSGDGTMALREGRFGSKDFRYAHSMFSADSAGLSLRGDREEEFSFLTSDVNLIVDLDDRMGTFTSNRDATRVELPYNLYETELDQMLWYMDEGKVMLSQNKILPGMRVDMGIDSLLNEGPVYTSTHPGQDGLHFTSPAATYDYRSRKLNAHGVNFMEVADAYILPDSGEVNIGYQASIELLENARILADQRERLYLVYEASVAVEGAGEYSGSGYYDYRDAFGNSHRVFFDRIWADTALISNARGVVEAEDPFMLSPWFDFKGDVLLKANEKLLTFDGGCRLVHDCEMGKDWMRFTAAIDPADISIPVGENMMNTDLNKLFAAMMITRDSTHIYSAFLGGRKDYFDAPICSASGVLRYDPERESYLIASEEKLADSLLPGAYLRLETGPCRVYAEGPVDLTLDYGQVKLKSAGSAVHMVGTDDFSTRIVMGLDFLLAPEAIAIMGSEIDSLVSLDPVDLTTHRYNLAMRDLLGYTMAGNLERQLALTGAYEEIPREWYSTIFFNDLPLAWNQDTRSFRYHGPVGIGNIGNIQVNKQVEAWVELVEKGSGDVFDIYLEAGDGTWYYIAYSPGGLQLLSSNRTFNSIILDMKEKDRRIKGGVGKASYIYSLAAQRRLELFRMRFQEEFE